MEFFFETDIQQINTVGQVSDIPILFRVYRNDPGNSRLTSINVKWLNDGHSSASYSYAELMYNNQMTDNDKWTLVNFFSSDPYIEVNRFNQQMRSFKENYFVVHFVYFNNTLQVGTRNVEFILTWIDQNNITQTKTLTLVHNFS